MENKTETNNSSIVNRKLIVVGDGACGKTCLVTTFTTNEFSEDYLPTVYDISSKIVKLEDKEVNLVLYDTAGEEDYDRLRPLSYPKTNVALLCFAIDNPTTLNNIKYKWSKEIKHFLPHVPFILVGNKLDLRTNKRVIEELRKNSKHPVRFQEGESMSRNIGAEIYMECSAKTMLGVRQVFEEAARLSFTVKKTIFSKCALL